jgi:hypothetical protein
VLVLHKSSPPMQHGKMMSANEEAVAMYVHDGYTDAAADLNLSGELYLHGGVDALVAHFISQLEQTRGWRAFVASLTMTAGYAARKAIPGGRVTKASVAITGIFDLLDEKAIEYSGIHSAEFIKYITDQAKLNAQGFINASLNGIYTVNQLERQLRNIITLTPRQVDSVSRAVDAYGASLGKEGIYTQQEIRDRMDEFHQKLSLQKLKQRTRAISRTELSTANNAGHLIGVANGIDAGYIHPDTMKQWNTAEDEKTCPICRPQDGETVRWDQPFSSGLMSPPAHVTCRCNFVDLPPDFENDPLYKPIPSEQQVYGDTVDQEFPADDWKGPDLTQIEHLLGEVSPTIPTLSRPSSGIIPDIEEDIEALDVVGLVRSVTIAIGEQFEELNLPQQEAIAAFVVQQGIGWKMSGWSPAQRAAL